MMDWVQFTSHDNLVWSSLAFQPYSPPQLILLLTCMHIIHYSQIFWTHGLSGKVVEDLEIERDFVQQRFEFDVIIMMLLVINLRFSIEYINIINIC